jgi:hypothetical protein
MFFHAARASEMFTQIFVFVLLYVHFCLHLEKRESTVCIYKGEIYRYFSSRLLLRDVAHRPTFCTTIYLVLMHVAVKGT